MFKMLSVAIALMMVLLCVEQAAAYRGGYGRGPRGGAVVVGPRGGVAVRGGAYRIGGRYYGGMWYGHARHWYGGRWWPYGVGNCWAPSPIGFVWICG
jgi:hypothetical protein